MAHVMNCDDHPITDSECRENHKEADGRFYFWRNGFLATTLIIFTAIGGAYLYVMVKAMYQDDKISAISQALGETRTDLYWIKKAQDEQKDTSKEILREVKDMKGRP